MLLGKTKKMIEEREKELQMYLSNNYKDEAYKSFMQYKDVINSLYEEGKIGQKDYEKLDKKIQELTKMFTKYKH